MDLDLEKTNSLFNLIIHQPDVYKIYLYAKYPYEAKYQLLINKRESTELKSFNDSKTIIEYSNDMDEIYRNIEECNPNKKPKILIVFDDMIVDMLSNIKLNPLVTELFIRSKKLSVSLVLLSNLIFLCQENVSLNSTHYYENSK